MRQALAFVLVALGVSFPARATEELDVRPDSAAPGTVLVGDSPTTRGLPLEVVRKGADGRSGRVFTSPDPNAFVLCDAIRWFGLARTRGPIDVVIRRGVQSAPVRLDYDGRTCTDAGSRPAAPKARGPVPTPRPVRAAKTDRTVNPMQLPVLAVSEVRPTPRPSPTPSPTPRRWRPLPTRVGDVTVTPNGRNLEFRVEFEHDVELTNGERCSVTRISRLDLGRGAEIRGPFSGLPELADPRTVVWRFPLPPQLVEPPFDPEERLELDFKLDGRDFEKVPASIGSPPR